MANAKYVHTYKDKLKSQGKERTEIWAPIEYKSGLWLLRSAIREDNLDDLQRAFTALYTAFQDHTDSKLPDARIPGRL